MFAIVQNGQIIKTIQAHTEFELNGKQYNNKWTVRMSAADKAALGITDIAYGPRPDERFYWVTSNGLQLVDGVPTETYTSTPKLLGDREESDAEGNPLYVQVYDPATDQMVNTTERLVTKGLKSQWIGQVKAQANSALAATDWVVLRKAERGVEIPADVAAERAAILQACADKEAAITAATTIEQLIAAVA